MRPFTLFVEVGRRIEPDDTPVRGNAMASGDDEADREVEDEILARLDRGEVEAWAGAIVEVTVGLDVPGERPGFYVWTGSDSLWGNSYASERELWQDVEEMYDLEGNAMREALGKMMMAAYDETSGYSRRFRDRLAKAAARWFARNPRWAVWADQWLEEHQR